MLHDNKSKNRKLQNHKNPSQALHEDGKKSLKKWRSLAKPRRGKVQQKLDLAIF